MRYIFILSFLFLGKWASAQNATDSVRAVVNAVFSAMKQPDTVMLRNIFLPDAIMQTVLTNEGTTGVRNGSLEDWIQFVGTTTPGDADERITIPSILIDGDMASVWTPYQFYYKGNLSHCGVNSISLVRTGNGWKVFHIVDTRRTTACR